MHISKLENPESESTNWENMIESQEPLRITLIGPVAAFIRHLADRLCRQPQDVIGGLAHDYENQYFSEKASDFSDERQIDYLQWEIVKTQKEREAWLASRKSLKLVN